MNKILKSKKSTSKIVMVFDTETSGLPTKRPGYGYSPHQDIELYDNCRLLQFSGIIYNFENNETLEEFDFIIKPENFIINNSHIHGITTEKANEEGIKISTLFEKIIEIFQKHDISKLVGHNVMFDINVTKSEMVRYMKNKQLVNFPILRKIQKLPYFCTMKSSTNICKIPNTNYPDKFKYPKLEELYQYVFGNKPENLHNSMNDAIYTLECLVELDNYELIHLFA